MTTPERRIHNELDEYLMNLSDSSDSHEDSGDKNEVSLDDTSLFKNYYHNQVEKASDEFCSI